MIHFILALLYLYLAWAALKLVVPIVFGVCSKVAQAGRADPDRRKQTEWQQLQELLRRWPERNFDQVKGLLSTKVGVVTFS